MPNKKKQELGAAQFLISNMFSSAQEIMLLSHCLPVKAVPAEAEDQEVI